MKKKTRLNQFLWSKLLQEKVIGCALFIIILVLQQESVLFGTKLMF